MREGCLTRIGDSAADIIGERSGALTEKGSEYLIESVIDRVLGGSAPAR